MKSVFKVYYINDKKVLIPADQDSQDWILKQPAGREIMVQVKTPRNINHHKKFFAMLNMVFDNTEKFKTADELLNALKFMSGQCEQRFSPKTGEMYYVTKSISFESMTQDEFSIFYNTCIDNILKYIIPDANQDFIDEIARM